MVLDRSLEDAKHEIWKARNADILAIKTLIMYKEITNRNRIIHYKLLGIKPFLAKPSDIEKLSKSLPHYEKSLLHLQDAKERYHDNLEINQKIFDTSLRLGENYYFIHNLNFDEEYIDIHCKPHVDITALVTT